MLATVGFAQADTTDIIQPQNETSDQGFQSGTCLANEEPAPPNKACSPETPGLFFTQAAGHPPLGFTQYIIEHEPFTPLPSPPFPPGSLLAPIPGEDIKEHTIKTLRTDLPPGLTVNPEATPSRCPLAAFENKVGENFVPTCDPSTKVGEDRVTLVTNKNEVEIAPGFKPPKGFVIPPTEGATKVPIYNLEPEPGEPAKLGFIINGKVRVFLETEVAWENDFHESFRIKLANTAEASGLSTLISRLMSNGRSGDETYLTNPTTCFDPNEPEFETLYSTWFRAESYGEPNPTFPIGSTPVEAKLPLVAPGERIQQTGCDDIPFEPTIETSVTTTEVDSPTGGTIELKLPFDPAEEGGEGISQSHLRRAEVTLPKGMGLNPSGSVGLVACSDAQFKKGVRVNSNECPTASKVGHAVIESPPLHEPLEGDIYVGEQKSMDPTSGEQFRILVEAKSETEGIVVRLLGNVFADPVTGQLTGYFTDQLTGEFAGKLPDGLPQVPFESVKLTFDESKKVLTSPPTCSPADTNGEMEPWARPGTSEPVSDSFTLTAVPGGGTCPLTLAERKFTPAYSAASDNAKAGSYSPFRVHIGRADGQQEVKGVTVTLPKGLTGKLAGIPYCPEATIAAAAAAAGKSGTTCPAASRLGAATTESGTGAAPLKLGGDAYLAGPYKGAPLSMVVVTPAVSGPFDLGTVVVRVALQVAPETAQITAVSDLIPDVFGGVKLDIRSINVDVDRPEFMKNPTSCAAQATNGTLNGGGGDPANPAAFSAYPVSSPYQANECKSLGFKPKFFTKLTGPVKRNGNPKLRAIVEARGNDANITRTALTLPSSLLLDNDHIGTVCTRAQLASKTCPPNSVYGQAEATTPLLDGKLKGPVYLVANPETTLPNLLADLQGQVNIQLRGVISSKRGGLKTVFNGLPDVPVKKFVLNMKGGKKSLLVNSQNICKNPQLAVLNIKGQNGKLVKKNKFRLNTASCKKK
ncbi:MAG TPA: hypothetical protein VFB52_00605 [Solirubrobacterales bacterium]|nr:hypothetical protein [Solirubrobacterales bacterium]